MDDSLEHALPRAQRERMIPKSMLFAVIALGGFAVLDALGSHELAATIALMDVATAIVIALLLLAARKWKSDAALRRFQVVALLVILASSAASSRLLASIGEDSSIHAVAVALPLVGIMTGSGIVGTIVVGTGAVGILLLDPSFRGSDSDMLTIATLAVTVSIVLVLRIRSDRSLERVVAEARRAHAEALAARTAAAEASARGEHLATIGTLVGSLSHGINNPLMVVGGQAEVARATVQELLADPALEPARRQELQAVTRSLRAVEQGAEKVGAVMRAFLLLSETRSTRRLDDVHDLLEDALVLAQIRVPPNVQVVLERGHRTPVSIDARDFFQIVLALLVDAGETCASTGGRVAVSARREGDDVVVLVEDECAPLKSAGSTGALSLARATSLAGAAGCALDIERPAAGGSRRVLRVPGAG